jgi:hypothetical protein
MGLLDIFNTYEGQQALGLLAAGGARSDGAGFGQRLQEGLGSAEKWKQQQAQAEMQKQQMMAHQQQMQMQAMQMQAMQQQAAKEQAMQALIPQFQKQGSAGLSPLAGNPEAGIMPSAGRSAVAPSFDYKGYAGAMAGIDPMKALQLQASLQKEGQINKLDVKDFTPQSVAKFAQSQNYGDLVRMDKAHFANTGGETVAVDPFTGQKLNAIQNTQSPDSKASNALGWANNSLTSQRLQFDKQGGAMKPQLVGDQWVTAPQGMQPGETRQAMPSVMQKDAKEALQLIETAKKIIPQSTGSYAGAGVDQMARFFGSSTTGDTAAAQLKALEGSLVSKMPKMSGPQSDKDVALYKQMAGEIGDPTIPQSRKLAALQVIEQIQQRNSGASAPAAPTMRWNPKTNTLEMVN